MEQERRLIEEMVYHETGHIVMCMVNGLIPDLAFVSLHGAMGRTELSISCRHQRKERKLWDITLAGYAWTRLFLGREPTIFFGDETGESDWVELGRPRRERVEKALKLYGNRRMPPFVNDLTERTSGLLDACGVIYNDTMHELYREFVADEEGQCEEWQEWFRRYHRNDF